MSVIAKAPSLTLPPRLYPHRECLTQHYRQGCSLPSHLIIAHLSRVVAHNLGVGDPVVRVLSDLDILCSAKHMSQEDLCNHANHDEMFSNSQVRRLRWSHEGCAVDMDVSGKPGWRKDWMEKKAHAFSDIWNKKVIQKIHIS